MWGKPLILCVCNVRGFFGGTVEAATTHIYINLLCRLAVFDVRKRGPDVAVARCGCLSMTMVEPSILTKKKIKRLICRLISLLRSNTLWKSESLSMSEVTSSNIQPASCDVFLTATLDMSCTVCLCVRVSYCSAYSSFALRGWRLACELGHHQSYCMLSSVLPGLRKTWHLML